MDRWKMEICELQFISDYHYVRPTNLTIIYANARSIKITETWMKKEEEPLYNFKKYESKYCSRPQKDYEDLQEEEIIYLT